MIAKVLRKSPWKDGIFPIVDIGLDYRTRQIQFIIEGTTDVIHINVQTRRLASMKFDRLKVGDRIKDFTLLKNKPIINPESSFVIHSDGALF